MKTTSFFVMALLMASVCITSAANINLVHKCPIDNATCDTEWYYMDNVGILNYTCVGVMTYTFTIVEPWNITANRDYSLVFYSHNGSGIWDICETGCWEKSIHYNQVTTLINNGTTDANGDLSFSGTFDFSGHGQGLEYINDGLDYDGSVKGAKVWLVPSVYYDKEEKRIVYSTPYPPYFFCGTDMYAGILKETDLVTCTEVITQTVSVIVPMPTVGFEVTPISYVYGEIKRGECSDQNPNGQITLKNTGDTDLQITTYSTEIFENIDYSVGGDWMDANGFSTEVNGETQRNIHTRICIPLDATYGEHIGSVTFEYIALLP